MGRVALPRSGGWSPTATRVASQPPAADAHASLSCLTPCRGFYKQRWRGQPRDSVLRLRTPGSARAAPGSPPRPLQHLLQGDAPAITLPTNPLRSLGTNAGYGWRGRSARALTHRHPKRRGNREGDHNRPEDYRAGRDGGALKVAKVRIVIRCVESCRASCDSSAAGRHEPVPAMSPTRAISSSPLADSMIQSPASARRSGSSIRDSRPASRSAVPASNLRAACRRSRSRSAAMPLDALLDAFGAAFRAILVLLRQGALREEHFELTRLVQPVHFRHVFYPQVGSDSRFSRGSGPGALRHAPSKPSKTRPRLSGITNRPAYRRRNGQSARRRWRTR